MSLCHSREIRGKLFSVRVPLLYPQILRSRAQFVYKTRYTSTMASESLHSSDERIHSRTQQSLLASQREKAAQVPTAPTGNPPRSGAMFPLGYKEGFSQWVRPDSTRKLFLDVIKCN